MPSFWGREARVSALTSPGSVSLQSQQPSPWDCGTTLHSSSQPCAFQEICVPVRGMYGCGKDCLILLPFRLPQISSFALSLKCFSSDSDNCPDVGIGPLLWFPHQLGAGPVLLTPLVSSLVPSSYRVVRGSIYSFPLVRSSCPFSTCALHALLCLKVCSWCIRGERWTPRPPTPPPSFSLHCRWILYQLSYQESPFKYVEYLYIYKSRRKLNEYLLIWVGLMRSNVLNSETMG